MALDEAAIIALLGPGDAPVTHVLAMSGELSDEYQEAFTNTTLDVIVARVCIDLGSSPQRLHCALASSDSTQFDVLEGVGFQTSRAVVLLPSRAIFLRRQPGVWTGPKPHLLVWNPKALLRAPEFPLGSK